MPSWQEEFRKLHGGRPSKRSSRDSTEPRWKHTNGLFAWGRQSWISSITMLKNRVWIKKLTRSCFLIPQIIQRQLEQVEEKQRQLEERGVAVEKALRGEAGISLFLSHFIPEMRCWRVKALEQIFITHAFLCSYTLTFRSKLLAVFFFFLALSCSANVKWCLYIIFIVI